MGFCIYHIIEVFSYIHRLMQKPGRAITSICFRFLSFLTSLQNINGLYPDVLQDGHF